MSSEDESKPVHKQPWFWPVLIVVFVVAFSGVAMMLALRGTTFAAFRRSLSGTPPPKRNSIPPDINLVPRTQNQSTQFPSGRRSSGGPVTPENFHKKLDALKSYERWEQARLKAEFGKNYRSDV